MRLCWCGSSVRDFRLWEVGFLEEPREAAAWEKELVDQ